MPRAGAFRLGALHRSAPVAAPFGQRGLTLIELLVVMLVLAAAAGVVAFNMPPAASEARKEAERFAAA